MNALNSCLCMYDLFPFFLSPALMFEPELGGKDNRAVLLHFRKKVSSKPIHYGYINKSGYYMVADN